MTPLDLGKGTLDSEQSQTIARLLLAKAARIERFLTSKLDTGGDDDPR